MAETETSVSTVDTQSTQQQSNEPAKAQENNTPTVEELMAQLATERAEKEKYKAHPTRQVQKLLNTKKSFVQSRQQKNRKRKQRQKRTS